MRTALAAWLFARSAGGRFLLRIEDLDPDRSRPEWEQRQLAQLRALGLDWDGVPVRQSGRLELYRDALADLERRGRVYPCFCTRAEIRAAASAPHGESPADALAEGAYPGTCRRLDPVTRARRLARGDRHALRFAAEAEPVSFTDRIAGPVRTVVDDFVLRRSDGVLAYQLAVVVDDAEQGVDEVVRGADLLDSTGRQILLMGALGLRAPSYAHVPLVMGPDGRRLAKRHGTAAGPDEPGAALAWLADSLGIHPPRPPLRAADLLADFSPRAIPAEPVTLDG